MRRLPYQFAPLLFLLCLVGCGFSPGEPGPPAGETGAAGTVGTGSGVGTGGSGVISGSGLSTGGDVGPETGAGGTTTCASGAVPIMPLPPDILIVQDKSLSMNQDPAGDNCTAAGCSKWEQVSTAVDTVVMGTQANVNWGLVFFGTNSTCGTTATPVVPVGPNAYAAIDNAYTTNQPASYTPTAAAINDAVTYMKTLTDLNPKYLLLATDGLPNCGSAGMTADDSTNAEAAVTAAKTAGFPTFVVGIGNTMGDATLTVFANNGGEPQMGAATTFYSVQSTADLETALNAIVGKIASCTISLMPVPAADANTGNFLISVTDASTGKPVAITQDATNGWSYTDATMTSIVLNGTSCTNLQNGTYSDFKFNYACVGQTICIDNCS